MARGSGIDDILYGQSPAREHAAMDQRRVDIDEQGVARHFDRYGQLEKIVVTPRVMQAHGKFSKSGVTVLRVDGIRFDTPAEIYVHDGEKHRDPEEGPAVIDLQSRRRVWYRHGRIHRDHGPAMIKKDGSEHWYRDDQKHRDQEDGPAITEADGTRIWMRQGAKHREDGPAVIYADGGEEWWNDGKLHREDGPAVIGTDGSRSWYHSGLQHREDGPAVIKPGSSEYFRSGALHREDGPAVIDHHDPTRNEFYFHGHECEDLDALRAYKKKHDAAAATS